LEETKDQNFLGEMGNNDYY